MTRRAIIERTINVINQLPEDKAEEISDFADFLIKKFEESRLTKHIHLVLSDIQSFNFLNEDEDIYTTDDLKVKYHG